MRTPDMKHDTHTWLMNQVSIAIDQKCCAEIISLRCGITQEIASDYIRKVMVNRSMKAVHPEHGCVRVFCHEGWKHYFIFHKTREKLLDTKKFGSVNWKCPPAKMTIEERAKHLGTDPNFVFDQ